MRLIEWLKTNKVTRADFSKASGVNLSTIDKLCGGGGAQVSTAIKIVETTLGAVDYRDLAPLKPTGPEEAEDQSVEG